jgi:hypothetical protein
MSGHGEKLTRKQDAAVAALLATPTLARAAEKAGVGESTLRRWLSLPAFQAEFRAARRKVVEHAVGQLQCSAAAAAATLRRNLRGGKAGDQTRAALGILGHAIDAVELVDLVERVEALESKLTGGEKR